MVTGTTATPRGDDQEKRTNGEEGRKNPVARFLKVLGPGLITGAADDDPSGVATYAQAGATYGYGMLWTVPVVLPLMMAVQEMCDRMALASGDSLGKLIRRKFTRGWRIAIGILLAALLVANCLNLSADLMAVGQGMELLHGGPAALWSAVAGAGIVVTLVFGSYDWIRRIFKWLCLALLIYVGVLFVSQVNWPELAAGLLGLHFQFSPAYLGLAVGVFGTSISPYMFFWQSQERIEEMEGEELRADGKAQPLPERSRAAAKRRQLGGRVDVFTGMVFSVLVMFAIIAATAATLGAHHKTVTSAADAARALEPIAGTYAGIFFAIGFIGSGILAVPVLAASGASGMAALLGKQWGFDDSPRKAPVFYILLGVGIIAGTVLAIFVNNPIQLLVLSAVVNGIAAGPFLVIMMLIARDRRIMHRYRNRALSQFLGWIATGIMCAGGVYGVWFTVTAG